MGYDDEQCPERGPGLRHQPDDHLTCRECGAVKTSGFTLADWMRAFRSRSPAAAPRVVKVSGEPDCETDEGRTLGDFAALTARQWHALQVERDYRERHPDPDDEAG